MRPRRFLPLTVLLLLAIGLHAQVTSTAPLSGTVTDQTGSVIPGTAVTVQNLETGTTYQAVTGANGRGGNRDRSFPAGAPQPSEDGCPA